MTIHRLVQLWCSKCGKDWREVENEEGNDGAHHVCAPRCICPGLFKPRDPRCPAHPPKTEAKRGEP